MKAYFGCLILGLAVFGHCQAVPWNFGGFFSHSFIKNDKLIGKVPYPYKMQSLGHDPDNGIKNTYQGESDGGIMERQRFPIRIVSKKDF